MASKEIAAVLEEKGIEMLDAPVSGGEPKAIDGTLSFMVVFKSLMCRSILKPGLSLPSIIMGALAFITVEPARPPFMA